MADPLIANIRRVCLANFPSGYQLGTHLTIENPVGFTHRGQQWADRVAARRAVRYDISYDPERDRWYLGASWAITPEPPASVEELRTGPVLGWMSTPSTWPAASGPSHSWTPDLILEGRRDESNSFGNLAAPHGADRRVARTGSKPAQDH